MNAFKRRYLRLHFQKDCIAEFLPLFQQGFSVEITTENILDMLCRICDMNPGQLCDLIQTLFLNGKPVDDMEKVFVKDGDCLALSAAMPGLVGATMRSGGVLAGFRRTISHRPPQTRRNAQGGVLTIKLFNLLIKAIGPRFLGQGVMVNWGDFRNLMSSLSKADWQYCETAVLNDRRIHPDDLVAMDWPEGRGCIHLTVTFGQPSNTVSPNADFTGNIG